jgi:hypothetical protein
MFEQILHESLHSSVPHEAVNYQRCNCCGGPMLIDSSGDRVCPRNFCREMRMSAQHGRHDLFLVLLFGEAVKATEMYREACEYLHLGRSCAA